jgi:hypothetical protein
MGFEVTFEILSASVSKSKTCLILVSVSPQHFVHLEHLNRMFFGYLNSAFCDGVKERSSEAISLFFLFFFSRYSWLRFSFSGGFETFRTIRPINVTTPDAAV